MPVSSLTTVPPVTMAISSRSAIEVSCTVLGTPVTTALMLPALALALKVKKASPSISEDMIRSGALPFTMHSPSIGSSSVNIEISMSVIITLQFLNSQRSLLY